MNFLYLVPSRNHQYLANSGEWIFCYSPIPLKLTIIFTFIIIMSLLPLVLPLMYVSLNNIIEVCLFLNFIEVESYYMYSLWLHIVAYSYTCAFSFLPNFPFSKYPLIYSSIVQSMDIYDVSIWELLRTMLL